ncbi:MAG: PKD domain-containing protein [Chitinophagaceae bacterium]
MKKLLLVGLFFYIFLPCKAAHIVGGEMIYEYIGPGSTPNTSQYRITLKLFRDELTTGAAMPASVFIGIFDNDTNAQFPGQNQSYDVTKRNEEAVIVNPFPSCITNPPTLNYHVGIYIRVVDLPINTKGYTATYQTCCRVNPLANVFNAQGVGGTGSTYSCIIPVARDNSPQFNTSVDAICRNKPFNLNFSALDVDGDSLVYFFAAAFNGGTAQNSANINPAPPPYASVVYTNNFGFFTPLGNQATINPRTGIISGIAPDVGKYVVCVLVNSYRNGILLGEHKKDFIVNVTDCDFAGAQLDPQGVTCDGFNVTFRNYNNSPLNQTFFWVFGDPSSGSADTSFLPSPIHTYTDTGLFVYKLVINRGQQCSDSATQIQKVYPGFFPDITNIGRCVNTNIQFKDLTKTNYGFVDSWRWDFGDLLTSDDTSHLQNPVYNYKNIGNYPVQLTVTNSKGCIKTIRDTLAIVDTPIFSLTNDTLICSIDNLQLSATGTGSIFWTPAYNINNQNSFTPIVSPKITTTYKATLTETPGCTATKSVVVKVVDNVTLNTGNDSTICQTDSVQLNIISDALHYKWTPASLLDNDSAKNPIAFPLSQTTFQVTGSIGKCNASGSINISVVPYPNANAGADTTICFPASLQLQASGGSSYVWSPPIFLNAQNIQNPVTTPSQSIRYIVSVRDILGCPKPAFDTVLVTVEDIVADAGPRDTIVVENQPLQLTGTGAEVFLWIPPTGLNNNNIANPVAVLQNNQQYVLRVRSAAGCNATDTINVIVYKVKPGLYVPSAFTPNGDGLNDVFRPIPIGMKSIKYFKVYNRRGQLIFSTTIQNKGWDGRYKGAPQDSQIFVWIVEGADYQDKLIFQKGTVTLIR